MADATRGLGTESCHQVFLLCYNGPRGRAAIIQTPLAPHLPMPDDMTASAADRRRGGLLPRSALILLVCLAAYSPALRGGFVWDDRMNVLENATLGDRAGLRTIWAEPTDNPQYYPVTYTAFWLMRHLWGLATPGYHLVNILLHGINAILLGVLLEGLAVPGAWLAAALFALHPVHVESVAWISELKNVLSGFFFLASLLAWFRPRRGEPAAAVPGFPAPVPWTSAALSLAFFVLALLSKTAVIGLPACILLIHWWKNGRVERRTLLLLLPFLAAGIYLGLVVLGREHVDVGFDREWFSLGWPARFLLAGRVVWFYLAKLALPLRLTFIYPRWTPDAGDWRWYLWPLGALALLPALGAGRRVWGRGPLAAYLWYLVLLAPVLGFIPFYFTRYSYVADHLQYLASIGPLALAAAVLRTATSSGAATCSPARRTATIALPLLALAILGTLTWRQCHVYRDEETVWRDTLAKNPGALMARINLGNILLERGNADDAAALFRQVLQRDPAYAEAHYNLANVLAGQGKLGEAAGHYWEVIRLAPRDARARNNLGALLLREDRSEQALLQFQEAARLAPADPEVLNNLGVAQMTLGLTEEARESFQAALRADPGHAKSRLNLRLLGGGTDGR